MVDKAKSYLDFVSQTIHATGPLDITWDEVDDLYRDIYREHVEKIAAQVLSDLIHDGRYYGAIGAVVFPYQWIEEWAAVRGIQLPSKEVQP